MTLTLSDFTGHEDANFRRLASIWDGCRTKAVPNRKELTFLKLLPISAKVVMLDVSQASPTIIYSGSDSLSFFYFDPQGVQLMQAFAYETFRPLMKAGPALKQKQGILITLARGDEGSYEVLALPISNGRGQVVKVVAIGAAASDEDKDGRLKSLISNHTDVTWQPVELGMPIPQSQAEV